MIIFAKQLSASAICISFLCTLVSTTAIAGRDTSLDRELERIRSQLIKQSERASRSLNSDELRGGDSLERYQQLDSQKDQLRLQLNEIELQLNSITAAQGRLHELAGWEKTRVRKCRPFTSGWTLCKSQKSLWKANKARIQSELRQANQTKGLLLRRRQEIIGRIAQLDREIDDFRRRNVEVQTDSIRHFPGIVNRIAIVSFEDSTGTQLGDALSFILSKAMLFHTNIESVGVVNFRQDLAPTKPSELSYFDKVDLVTRGQDYVLAIWGHVKEEQNGFRIDTFAQIPVKSIADNFSFKLQLPNESPNAALITDLRPNRFLVQSFHIQRDLADSVVANSEEIRMLRSEPSIDATVNLRLAAEATYWIDGRQGEWVLLQTSGGSSGWTSAKAHCSAPCKNILDASNFLSGLVRYSAGRGFPQAVSGLSTDALAVSEFLVALDALKRCDPQKLFQLSNTPDDCSPEQLLSITARIAERWSGPNRLTGIDEATGIDRGKGLPPGGASFANLQAVGEIAAAIIARFSKDSSAILNTATDQNILKETANELAQHTLQDPSNPVLLQNLVVFFDAIQDQKRASLARNLAAELDKIH